MFNIRPWSDFRKNRDNTPSFTNVASDYTKNRGGGVAGSTVIDEARRSPVTENKASVARNLMGLMVTAIATGVTLQAGDAHPPLHSHFAMGQPGPSCDCPQGQPFPGGTSGEAASSLTAFSPSTAPSSGCATTPDPILAEEEGAETAALQQAGSTAPIPAFDSVWGADSTGNASVTQETETSRPSTISTLGDAAVCLDAAEMEKTRHVFPRTFPTEMKKNSTVKVLTTT